MDNSPLFTWRRTFPATSMPIYNRGRQSDLPLTCTKLIEVDRLGSGLRSTGNRLVPCSVQTFALTAGRNVLGKEGNCPGEYVWGEYVQGKMSLHSCDGPVQRCDRQLCCFITILIIQHPTVLLRTGLRAGSSV